MGKQLAFDYMIRFEEVFRKYYPSLLAFVTRHVGDRETAKDFVQDVFFKLYESKVFFPSESSLKSWLFMTSRNAALDYLRHLKVVDQHQILMAESMIYAHEVDEKLDETLVRKIQKAVDSLPAQCRQIVRMNIIDGRKYTEISEELGISINTVRTQISRGYRRLRTLLSGDTDALLLLFIGFSLLRRPVCRVTEQA
ncbi:MAG: RNA polymerase sigma-70 factor [Odoribacter sp.]|nr:RNA polymerase sigma-70 factor [Odoribacter sp.]